jgi:hypothetical protein
VAYLIVEPPISITKRFILHLLLQKKSMSTWLILFKN